MSWGPAPDFKNSTPVKCVHFSDIKSVLSIPNGSFKSGKTAQTGFILEIQIKKKESIVLRMNTASLRDQWVGAISSAMSKATISVSQESQHMDSEDFFDAIRDVPTSVEQNQIIR